MRDRPFIYEPPNPDELVWKSALVTDIHSTGGDRTLGGIITSTNVDEEGEVVVAAGMDRSYSDRLKGASVLRDHEYTRVCGKIRRLEPVENGTKIYSSIRLMPTDLGDESLILGREGALHFSIGFTRIDHGPPTEEERRMWPGVKYVTRTWRLHELTLTPVPCNADAIITQKALRKMRELHAGGKIHFSSLKDAEKMASKLVGFGAPAEKRISFASEPTRIGFRGV